MNAQADPSQSNVHPSSNHHHPNEEKAILKLEKIYFSFKCMLECDSNNFVSSLCLMGQIDPDEFDDESMTDNSPGSEQGNMGNERPSELASNNHMEPLQVVWDLKHIQKLDFTCFQHNSIPEQIGNLKSLKRLSFGGCNRLFQIPHGIGNLENLRILRITCCERLQSLPPSIGNLKTLKLLEIRQNQSLETLPPEIGHLENLTTLEIQECPNLVSLQGEIGQLRKLERMSLIRLPRVQSLPSEFLQFSHELQNLTLVNLTALTTLENVSLNGLHNLTSLALELCNQLESLPIAIQMIPALKELGLCAIPRRAVLSFFSKPWAGITGPKHMCLQCGWHCSESYHFLEENKLGRDYASILPGLPPTLQNINFDYQGIDNLNGFLDRGIPSSLITLGLNDNPIERSLSQEDQDCLHKLLETYPKLSFLDMCPDSELLTKDSHYLLHLNRCGRILLGNQKPIPLSVWPLVLDRVKYCIFMMSTASVSMEASVLFFLLHGPALLDRADGFETCAVVRKRKFVA